MDLYVWRVPTLFGLIACSALVLFAAGVVASVMIRRWPSTTSKLGIRGSLVLLAILCGIAIRAAATRIAGTIEVSVTYVDPGPLGYLAPPAFAAFAFAVGGRTLGRKWTGLRAAVFCAWLVVFTAANVVNRCAPGWCETIGFPLAWYAWSDSIVTFADDGAQKLMDAIESLGHAVGAGFDLFTFYAVSTVLARVGARSRTD